MPRSLKILAAAAMTALGTLALGLTPASALPPDDPAAIKDVMKKLNGKGQNESGKLKKALNASKPDWDAIQGSTKKFADLGADLPKNDPPKGSKDSWKKLADAYATQTKSLNDAAEKKDLDGTKKAFQKINTSCMPCHQAHRGR